MTWPRSKEYLVRSDLHAPCNYTQKLIISYQVLVPSRISQIWHDHSLVSSQQTRSMNLSNNLKKLLPKLQSLADSQTSILSRSSSSPQDPQTLLRPHHCTVHTYLRDKPMIRRDFAWIDKSKALRSVFCKSNGQVHQTGPYRLHFFQFCEKQISCQSLFHFNRWVLSKKYLHNFLMVQLSVSVR